MEFLSGFLAGGKSEREIQPRANFCTSAAKQESPSAAGPDPRRNFRQASSPHIHEARVSPITSHTG